LDWSSGNLSELVLGGHTLVETLQGIQPAREILVRSELILFQGADLAAKRDPVLAHAAALVSVKLDPEKAGSLFPKEWRKQ